MTRPSDIAYLYEKQADEVAYKRANIRADYDALYLQRDGFTARLKSLAILLNRLTSAQENLEAVARWYRGEEDSSG